jgi:hypothetical protein
MRGVSNLIRLKNLKIYALTIFAIFVIHGNSARCEEDGITPVSLLKFTGGVISAFLIHEGGHALVAGVTGTDMDWEFGNYNQPIAFTEDADSDAAGLAVNAAGLTVQAIGSEVILQVDSIDKNDAYVRGMMTWNIINPILYALDYWFIRRTNQSNGNSYQGDLEGIEFYSNENVGNTAARTFVSIAVFQGYRFLKTQTWAPDWITNENYNLNLSRIPEVGLLLSYRIQF